MGRRKDPSKYKPGKPCPKCFGTLYYKLKAMSTVCVACQQAFCIEYKRKTGLVQKEF